MYAPVESLRAPSEANANLERLGALGCGMAELACFIAERGVRNAQRFCSSPGAVQGFRGLVKMEGEQLKTLPDSQSAKRRRRSLHRRYPA